MYDYKIIRRLPRGAALDMAREHMDTASRLIDHVGDLGATEASAAKRQRRLGLVRSAADMAAAYMATGMSLDAACRAAAQLTGCEAEALAPFLSQIERTRRRLRDAQIARLFQAGWDNAKIAEAVGFKHPKSVQRIIGRLRKKENDVSLFETLPRDLAALEKMTPQARKRHLAKLAKEKDNELVGRTERQRLPKSGGFDQTGPQAGQAHATAGSRQGRR